MLKSNFTRLQPLQPYKTLIINVLGGIIPIVLAVSPLENADTMGKRMGRMKQISTDFFWIFGLKIREC